MERTILHLDLDAFYCAVEELRNPTLKGIPFAVGGRADARGVVASCSYPARQYGVRSAMPMSQAKRLCPQLVVVRWNHSNYRDVSRQVMDILHDLTPLVEQLSIDEAFLDVSEIDDEPMFIAADLQERIGETLKLPCSLGVASNKLVAKIANNIGKASAKGGEYPNAVTIIPPGEEAAFLAPLPVRELWGVGPKTEEKLAELGIHTIGDLAAQPKGILAQRFGKLGVDLAARAWGQDDRPVVTQRETKSISRETTFERDISDPDTLKRTLRDLSASVGERMRRKELQGKTVTLKLRWSDFTTLTRQVTLEAPTDSDELIYTVAARLLDQHKPRQQHVRLIGVGVSGFQEAVMRQLSLWDSHQPPPDYL